MHNAIRPVAHHCHAGLELGAVESRPIHQAHVAVVARARVWLAIPPIVAPRHLSCGVLVNSVPADDSLLSSGRDASDYTRWHIYTATPITYVTLLLFPAKNFEGVI